jgi:hypothetical protein
VARALYVAGVQYGLSNSSVNGYFEVTQTVWDMKLADGSGRDLYALLKEAWNSGEHEITKQGTYRLTFEKVPLHSLHGETVIFDRVSYDYVVKEEARLGSVGAEKARGLYNVRTQTFTTAEDVVFEPVKVAHISDWELLSPQQSSSEANFQLVGVVPLPDVPPISHEPVT